MTKRIKPLSHRDQQELRLEESQPFPPGFHYLAGYLDHDAQLKVLADVEGILKDAPLFEQRMPRSGAPLSVRTSNAGSYGWVTDRDQGYRYQQTHPITGKRWPAIPPRLLKIWADTTQEDEPCNLCLINFYDEEAKLGVHQDKGDSSLAAPVVSISLGDDATFIFGGESRRSALRRLELRSGDIVWFEGLSRLIHHGVEGIRPDSSDLLRHAGFQQSGRINLTLRRVDRSV
jgi:alkylated DNA repair protein (DNA oxidative demethylase)